MKRFVLVLTIFLVAASAGLFAYEPYDSAVGVAIMRANGSAFGQLSGAQASGDLLQAAGALAVMADGSFRLLQMAAPQGSQEEWERIHSELIVAALRGIQACAEGDTDALDAVVGMMGSFSRDGHGQFR